MATLQLNPNSSSDVYPGGQTILAVQFETYVNSGMPAQTGSVTLTIAASGASDSGTGTPVPSTGSGFAQLGMGQYQYTWDVPSSTVPGSYIATWTGVRQADDVTVTYTQAVNVASPVTVAPLPGVYATVAQYRDRTADQFTPGTRVQQALQLASEDIDVALVGAVYGHDADGMPTDPGLAAILARATCAQAAYVIAKNDDNGLKQEYSSTSVGGLSQTRAASMQARALRPICQQAIGILRVNGISPTAPLISY